MLTLGGIESTEIPKVIEQYFDAVADSEDSFTALNTAFGRGRCFCAYPKKKRVEKPIQIIHFSTVSIKT